MKNRHRIITILPNENGQPIESIGCPNQSQTKNL